MPSRKKIHRSHVARISIAFTKKVGARSIYDIINNEMPFQTKINYIRHHYTYYDSFQDMFHDEKGKENENAKLLQEILAGIVNKQYDPSIISQVNQTMVDWRKEHPLVEDEDIENFEPVVPTAKTLKKLEISRKTSSKTKDECVKQFKQEFPYLYNRLNSQALDKVAVNHYKSSLYVPTEQEWRNSVITYCKINNTELSDNEWISYKKFKKIMDCYKIFSNNLLDKYLEKEAEESFNSFANAYNKYFEKQEKEKTTN